MRTIGSAVMTAIGTEISDVSQHAQQPVNHHVQREACERERR